MNKQSEISKLPSRIKYYLLEWKDHNMDEYLHKYGELRLADLDNEQLKALYIYATKKDIEQWN